MNNILKSSYSFLLPLVLLLCILGILLFTSVMTLKPVIEEELGQKVKQELAKLNIPAEIILSGRDLTLRGKVSDEQSSKEAESTVRKVCGIRFIENELLVNRISPEQGPVGDVASVTTDEPAADKLAPGEASETETPIAVTKAETEEPEIPQPAMIDKTSEQTEAIAETTAPDNEQIRESSEPTDTANVQIAAETKQEEIATTEADKPTGRNKQTNTLNYESMLAAMQEYYKNKENSDAPTSIPDSIEVLFKDNGSEIDESSTSLKSLANALQNNKQQKIEIVLTNSDVALALLRAKAIQAELIKMGTEQSQIQPSGIQGSSDSIQIKKR